MNRHNTTKIGQLGEESAARFLYSSGFEILERNWRYGHLEIDIIAKKDNILHIVEVKCRKQNCLTTPQEALTSNKFKLIQRATEQYIEQFNINCEVQIDLIAVIYNRDETISIEYIPDIRLF